MRGGREMQAARRREGVSMYRGYGFSPEKSTWLSLSVLVLLLQEISGRITVTQTPSVVVSKLNENVTLACRFSHTTNDEVTGIILYWYHAVPNQQDEYVYPPSHALPGYQNRVVALSHSGASQDKSVVLLNASWTDSHKYRCLLSYEVAREPNRMRGDGVLLLLHGSMTFDRVPETASSLMCSVRVSPDPRFHLSLYRDGVQVRGVSNRTSGPCTTLWGVVPLQNTVEYECRLGHGARPLLSRTYVQRLPEPVLLYVAILLVPFIVLVIFLTALIIIKSRH